MSTHPRPVSVWNIANAITVARIALIPLFVYIVVQSGMDDAKLQIIATAVFLIASLTDFLDGWLARSRGLVTSFGKLADPIADKALIGAALILFSFYEVLPWWVTVIILVRELGITGLRMAVLRHAVIPAGSGGKAKTVFQISAVAWYLFPWPEPIDMLGPILMAIAFVLTVFTGLDYLWKAWKVSGRNVG
ncbi:CDP-diacylglycerol--glycerol-3-phosphate 3-phosphatidyltransferase [Haloglycomyces albus]|uniref:CDP-diacylglycerol--glycerol-3-phosphate 3-phosphatidyltransferase n=1 Tax=Haloglycomyces albus TaxID=526067 RepID=UPI00046D7169|nr:CDP-diacylglycerol--glycerol-3-phosphate 3-phosphatidyltransferase [Haloglycomyces albus]